MEGLADPRADSTAGIATQRTRRDGFTDAHADFHHGEVAPQGDRNRRSLNLRGAERSNDQGTCP